MITLTREAARIAVRKNIDEQEINSTAMYGESTDNTELDSLIDKTIPEAINAVNAVAPVSMLEGEQVEVQDFSIEDNVASFSVSENIMRLVAFKMSDSPVVLAEVISELSPEGRKQLNRYIRGTYDNPVLIQAQGESQPFRFRYYTTQDEGAQIDKCLFVKFEQYDESEQNYNVSEELYEAILYQLTSMVLLIYGQTEAAQAFAGMANAFFNKQ